MTITRQDELDGLREIGRIVANTMQTMAKTMEPDAREPQAQLECNAAVDHHL